MNKKKQMGIIKFFSDATGEANADGKVEHFKWYFDTSRKLSEWYDNRAIKPTSLSIELGTNISYVMYEITEDGILTFGMDQYPQNHILSHKDIFLGKRLATKEAPH